MTETLGETPAPMGAPETTLEPGEGGSYFESGRPRLGGLAHPIAFSDDQAAVLDAVADTMIPPADGWPAPSEIGIVTFVGRYVTPSGYRNKHFPFAEEDPFKAGLDRLGSAFLAADAAGRTEAITALEEASTKEDGAEEDGNPLFEQLRALVYYGYYSRPETTLAIRANVVAGRDYHGPPLPYGYLESTEDWDESLLASARDKGSFLETDDVVRVDLSKVDWVQRQHTAAGKES